ncbi:selenocysteine-specific translation elongation factor [Methylobacterium haplocladii]|uniref:Selenocysteine-specific elongation factor n=1 Tax=Methylobacterium haplocladii TaxID=1176176 RepID=A0A512IU94_9HYPH|nr:selenocysteine-specific translation elongation factor [Methylobacterium haplocladii]GEP01261.1 selenocysteine-specific translation elongation factor [Methylobacterium haplocladii]GJD82159.1 Selenocysteine-specific elongation factor [Methylobacterium haplocladii]GLS60620.1 selenocysteine-specific translation elongation factor [Methylobacterium haplocladii]
MTPSLLVGVIGHVDHGKTALVRALTGIDTDRLKEEKARGVSIVPGFALLKPAGAEAGEIDLVDLPGHERFVRAMISGATGMRAVLLAVDANEGIKPQTVEHLEIARLIGVRRGVIALTKCDLVGAETIAARKAELLAVATRAGIEQPKLVATSVLADTGLAELRAALSDLLREAPPSGDDGFPYLPIDRVFARPGFGAVVTGTLRRGRLTVGDRVAIMPGQIGATVRSLQIHGRPVQVAEPGRRTAVALRGVEIGDLHRGQALAAPDMLTTGRWIDVVLTAVVSAEAPLEGGTACRLLFGTTEVAARLRLLDRDRLEPGASTLAQLRTDEDIAVPAREPFILRLDSPSVTVAGGRILDPLARRRKRHDARVHAELAVTAAGKPKDTLATRLARDGAAGTPLVDLARLVGIAPDRVRRGLTELGAREIGDRFLGAPAFAGLREALLAALALHHRDHSIEHGLPLDRLARAVTAGETVVTAALRDLVATRDVVQAGPLFRRADFDPGRHETEHVRVLEAAFRQGALSPPDEVEIVGRDIRRREALTYLLAAGTLIRALDRVQKRTILFHKDAITAGKAQLARSFPAATVPDSGFLAKEAGAALGISRKFSIPLLEHLDAVRFTRRVGDRRIFVEGDA